jgi:hypothetical protein
MGRGQRPHCHISHTYIMQCTFGEIIKSFLVAYVKGNFTITFTLTVF